jgi:hypothetical protein
LGLPIATIRMSASATCPVNSQFTIQPDQFFNIGCSRVAESHGGIRSLEEVRNGFANNITTPKDDSTFAGDIDPGFFKQNHHTLWRAGNKVRFARSLCEFPDIEGMEPINVFEGRNSSGDDLLVDVFGQGKLDEDSMDRGIGIEVFDCAEEFLLRDLLGIYRVREFDIGLAIAISLVTSEEKAPPEQPFLSCGHRSWNRDDRRLGQWPGRV